MLILLTTGNLQNNTTKSVFLNFTVLIVNFLYLPAFCNVNFHCTLGVDGEALVWIDGNAEETRVGVDELVLVPDNRVPQDASIIQVGQAGHVIRAVKLRGVNLTNLVSLENFFLKSKFNLKI